MRISMANQGARRTGRARRKGVARRLEVLEARTLLNASIDIDADGLLTYKTDDSTAETLNISVSGGVYTFASDVDIDVLGNVPGLTIGGEGTETVTVEGLSGLAVDLNYEGDLFFLLSADVATAINWNVGYATARLGNPYDAAGLGALSAPITVTGIEPTVNRHLLLNDYGSSTDTTYTLTPTTLMATNGFGGLTYSNAGALTLLSSTASNEFIVEGTAGGVVSNLAVTNPGTFSNTFTVKGTSSDPNSHLSLNGDVYGGGGSNTFNIEGASSTISIQTGSSPGLGTATVNLGNSEGVAGISGTIFVNNFYGASVDIVADNLAGVYSAPWKLSGGSRATLTGFKGGGALSYVPSQINSLTLGGLGGPSRALTVDFKDGNPLPSRPGGSGLSLQGDGLPRGAQLLLRGGSFVSQTHDFQDLDRGQIILDDGDAETTITYDGINWLNVYDVISADDYTFNAPEALGWVFAISRGTPLAGGSGPNVQTLLLAPLGGFDGVHVGLKRNITVHAGSTPPSDTPSLVVNYREPDPWPRYSTLENLTIVTSGEGRASLVNLPPHISTSLQQGDDDDRATIAVEGLDQTNGARLDGGAGNNALTIDAGGRWLSPTQFSTGPGGSTAVSAPVQGGPITYSNYQQVSVVNLGSPPLAITGQTIQAIQGRPVVNAVVATFVVATRTAGSGDFDAIIDWGDGTSSAGRVIQNSSDPSRFSVMGTHEYGGAASRRVIGITVTPGGRLLEEYTRVINGVPVTFEAATGRATSAIGWADVTITDLPPSPPVVSGVELAGVQGQPFDNVVVATFNSDAPGAKATDFDAEIFWGDNSPSAVGSIIQDPQDPSLFYVMGSHTYYEYAPRFEVATVVTSSGSVLTEFIDGAPVDFRTPPSGPVEGRGEVKLDRAPLTITVNSFNDVEHPAPGPSTIVLATFSQPGGFNPADPDPAAHYLVEVNWGDASDLDLIPTENILYDEATDVFTVVVPRHHYTAPGSYEVSVTISERAAGTAEAVLLKRGTGVAHISTAPPQPTIPDALAVTGQLDPASDSGVSNSDAITNVRRPNFFGLASEPGASVFLYATPWGGSPILIGQTTADAPSGAWSITSDVDLADGGYIIQARASDASGQSASELATITPNLVIDTVGPRIIDAQLVPIGGRALLTFEDFGGPENAGTGLVQSALANLGNYRFSMVRPPLARHRPGPRLSATAVKVDPGTTAGPQRATVQINNGRPIRPARYLAAVSWATAENPSGVADIAGNSLEGPIEWRLAPARRTPIRPTPPPRPPIAPPSFRLTTMRSPTQE